MRYSYSTRCVDGFEKKIWFAIRGKTGDIESTKSGISRYCRACKKIQGGLLSRLFLVTRTTVSLSGSEIKISTLPLEIISLRPNLNTSVLVA